MRGPDWMTYRPDDALLRDSVAVTRRMKLLAIPTEERMPISRMTGPGRLRTRAAVRAEALADRGDLMAASKIPLFRTQQITRTIRPPGVVGIMADVSSSMKWSTTAVGEAAWLLARGAAHAGATVASVAFGREVDPIVFPGEIPDQVLVRLATSGFHAPDKALAALDGALGLSRPGRSRVVLVISDLMWSSESIPFLVRARRLMASGVRFIVIGPGLLVEFNPERNTIDRLAPSAPAEIMTALGYRLVGSPADVSDEVTRYYSPPHGGWKFAAPKDPAPATPEELRIMRSARIPRLDPVTVIPVDTVLDKRDPSMTRRRLVDAVLTALESMG